MRGVANDTLNICNYNTGLSSQKGNIPAHRQ